MPSCRRPGRTTLWLPRKRLPSGEVAGDGGEARVVAFLDEHSGTMPRAALRLAIEKLPADARSRFV